MYIVELLESHSFLNEESVRKIKVQTFLFRKKGAEFFEYIVELLEYHPFFFKEESC